MANFAGSGGTKEGAVESCTTCKGTGMQVRLHQIGPGMMQQIQSVCAECRGKGERIDPKYMCKECKGQKVIRDRKILEVHIDKGKYVRKLRPRSVIDSVRDVICPLLCVTSSRQLTN